MTGLSDFKFDDNENLNKNELFDNGIMHEFDDKNIEPCMSNEKENKMKKVAKTALRIFIALLIIFLGACLKYGGSSAGTDLGRDYIMLSGKLLTLFGLVYLFSNHQKIIEEMHVNDALIGYKGKIGRKKYFINSCIYILTIVITGFIVNHFTANYVFSNVLTIMFFVFVFAVYAISICNDKRRISDIRGTSRASLWNSIFISLFLLPFAKIIGIIILSILPGYNNERTIKQNIKERFNRIKTLKIEDFINMFKEGGIMRTPVALFISVCIILWLLFNMFGYERHIYKNGSSYSYRNSYDVVTINKLTHKTTVKRVSR